MPSSHAHELPKSRTRVGRPPAAKAGKKPTEKATITKKSASVSSEKESWQQVKKFLDETDEKLERLELRASDTAEKVQARSLEKIDEFEGHWLKALDWIQERTQGLKPLTDEAGQLVDKTRVQSHLAKMEAQDFVKNLKPYIDKIKDRVDRVIAKSTAQSAESLQKLSDACLKLKEALDK